MPTIEITSHSPEERCLFSEIHDLDRSIFASPYPIAELEGRLVGKQNILLLVARHEGNAIGYKWGYALESGIFYSWIGGVLPDFRGRGVARALMERQHEWCRAQGFRAIRTKTRNRFREMLVLNLRSGFDIVSTFPHADGELRIVLEKRL